MLDLVSVPLSLRVDITDEFACSIKIYVRLQFRSYTSTSCNKKLDKALISLLCKTKTKTKTKFSEKNFRFKNTENRYQVTISSLLF